MNTQNSATQHRSYSRRASDMWDTARDSATTPRVAAAGAVAVGALAYAFLRDKDRRDRLSQTARDYSDRAANWWHGSSKTRANQPSAPAIG